MHKEELKQLSEYYLRHILDDVMPFWDARCVDEECGGFFTCFDRQGNLTDDNKYIWFQGRQTYTYALLYNHIEKRRDWLDKARHGFRFLADKAYAGGGRWNYKLDRQGHVLVGTTSVFADMHVLQALGEYNTALGGRDAEAMAIMRATYDTLERNFTDRYFKDIYENTWKENHIWHDMYMTALSAVMTCIPVLGEEYTRPFMDECLDKICNWFARDDYRAIFETVSWDNQLFLEEPADRFTNPGHSSEAVWFILEYARSSGRENLLHRAVEFEDWVYERGYDKVYGGLNSYLDVNGTEPVAVDWFLATNSLWDDKVWWANAEQLCALAMTYEAGKNELYWERFLRHHQYCRSNFFDPEYGEWYERLNADGSVKVDAKGTEWKCAFHLVRALVYTLEALRRMEAAQND